MDVKEEKQEACGGYLVLSPGDDTNLPIQNHKSSIFFQKNDEIVKKEKRTEK